MNSININHFQFYTNSSRQYNKSNKIPNLFCDIRITLSYWNLTSSIQGRKKLQAYFTHKIYIKILNKISANWIQQCIKSDNPYVYKAFITGTEVEFDVRKSINVVPSMNRLKDKNQMIVSRN